jgi:hypothetical protein
MSISLTTTPNKRATRLFRLVIATPKAQETNGIPTTSAMRAIRQPLVLQGFKQAVLHYTVHVHHAHTFHDLQNVAQTLQNKLVKFNIDCTCNKILNHHLPGRHSSRNPAHCRGLP